MRGLFTFGLLSRDIRSLAHTLLRVSELDIRSLSLLLVLFGIVAMTGCVAATGEKVPSGSNSSGEPLITVSPTSLNFGTEAVGGSVSQTVMIYNVGTSSLSITQLAVTGAAFNVASLTLPATVAAGGSASVTITFKPSATGTADGSLSITSNATSAPIVVGLTGVGQSSGGSPGISASPAPMVFGNVAVGSYATSPLTITNTGSANLVISNITESGSSFLWTGPTVPATLTPGQKSSLTIEFDPKSNGSLSGSISVASNAAGSPMIVSLSGTGASASYSLSANPSSLSFGNVTVGSTSTLDVTLTNTGNSSVQISTVTASGSGYSVTGGSDVTLNPSQSTSIEVSLKPGAKGSDSGTVSVKSNAQNSPLSIPLTGTGVQSNPESVALSWVASTSEVKGYNVYRGTSTSGPYTKLNSSPDGSTSYADSSVANNTTYYYYVTSVSSSNVESSPSNKVTITVP
jgi:centrosomal CEP192-like protein/HYDIN/CFA65/VesB family protein